MERLPQEILATVNCDADKESSYILGSELLVLVTLMENTWKT